MDWFLILTSLAEDRSASSSSSSCRWSPTRVYAERRVSALIQDRLGPNRVGPCRVCFQPIADAVKFLLKEDFTPAHVNKFYYWLAPCLAMIPAIATLAVVPFGSTLFGVPMVIADINVGVLYRLRDRLARRLRHRPRRLVFEFEISLPRRHPLAPRR